MNELTQGNHGLPIAWSVVYYEKNGDSPIDDISLITNDIEMLRLVFRCPQGERMLDCYPVDREVYYETLLPLLEREPIVSFDDCAVFLEAYSPK